MFEGWWIHTLLTLKLINTEHKQNVYIYVLIFVSKRFQIILEFILIIIDKAKYLHAWGQS
jgi:hypothetical protein